MCLLRLRVLTAAFACMPLAALAADPQPKPQPQTEQDFTDAIRKPTDWLNLGADLRLRNEYLNDAITLDQDAPGHEMDFQRYRARVWSEIMPCKEFSIYSRFLWEGRHYFEPDTGDSWPKTDILIDNLYFQFRHDGDVAFTLTAGRQDIIFGTGWLILEGTPLDGSRSIYFDAVRGQVNFKKIQTSVDLVGIYQPAEPDFWYHPINNTDNPMAEQDQNGAVVYVTNRTLPKANVEGYFIYKDDKAVLPNGVGANIYTLGGALSGRLSDNWSYRAEGAGQWGVKNFEDHQGFGFNGRLNYAFNDNWKNRLSLQYEFLSGDDPDTAKNEAFDPLWGRWPQWSELYVYTYLPETRIAEVTNLHRAALAWEADPTSKLGLTAAYHALFADQNTRAGSPMFDSSGKYRGSLFTAMAKYRFNRHFSGHVLGEYFIPGDYYDDNHRDPATYFRVELLMTL